MLYKIEEQKFPGTKSLRNESSP